jgi:undecaprenyl pyrophosphate phosphatase UppP
MNDPVDIRGRLTYAVTLMVSATLCVSVVVMVVALVAGLWFDNIDNAEIFKLISPAFQTIIGGFIGLLAGIKLGNADDSPPTCQGKKQ